MHSMDPKLTPLQRSKENSISTLLRIVEELFSAVEKNDYFMLENEIKEEVKHSSYCVANAKCVKNETLLHFASKKGRGCSQVFEGGNTALHVAAAQGQSATFDILMRHCQDRQRRILQNVVNATNEEGSTPLHVAVDVKTVKCLLKHGALYDAKNKANRTPLDLCQDEEIRSLLQTVEDLFSSVQNGKGDDMVRKLESLILTSLWPLLVPAIQVARLFCRLHFRRNRKISLMNWESG
ncbi:ANK_REP_REGION domain-containing protein [Caerostris extrusa]|uniref:ANK_REP_REGION domain-containing protein n=1 Tax=Caerostris extrusa TaxID=172846 RepID=A0AAV4SBR1_CAEEX|nr:ANK_REP_REGION domain-containing protein [Caerostris extrusa]